MSKKEQMRISPGIDSVKRLNESLLSIGCQLSDGMQTWEWDHPRSSDMRSYVSFHIF